MTCPDCRNAFRVLDATGQTRAGFRWLSPFDLRSQREALEAEGVRFDGDRADVSKRLPAAELSGLLGGMAG